MHSFDALPAPESMQAIFEPVMILGHREEQDNAECQHHVAGRRPPHFVGNDRAQESTSKDGQAPGGESRAGASAAAFQSRHAAKTAYQACLAGRAGWCLCHGAVVHNGADDTGSLR